MIRLIILLGLIFVFQSPAYSKIDGNRVLESCRGKTTTYQALCNGYIGGVIDGIKLAFTLTNQTDEPICKINTLDDSVKFQLPDGNNLGQVVDVVVKFLDENPEIRHYDASVLVLFSLRKYFPCK
jgi:hypothetical protein